MWRFFMKLYDTVIIGGGPAGVIAGIYLKGKTLLLEKNDILLKKMLLTGGGRCNLTNKSTLDDYMKSFYNNGKFYRTAFTNFFNDDIIKLLEKNGCKTKIEENKRVFPESDKSETVKNTLTDLINKSGTDISTGSCVERIQKKDDHFRIYYNNNLTVESKNLILACGGNCYPKTGSSGEGYSFLESLGHSITEQMGGLCPVKIKEEWIRRLQGITIETHLEILSDKKSISKTEGSLLFTHNGLSGFVILDNSMQIEKHMRKKENVTINLDFCHEYSYESLDEKLRENFSKNSNQKIRTCIHEFLPKRMSREFLSYLNIDSDKILNQITKKERIRIRDNLKRLTLTVDKVLEEEAMVTNSGVKRKEINPDTFESKIVNNLYIVGELIEGCGICGGYNLQQAYSTGFTAAKSVNGDNL